MDFANKWEPSENASHARSSIPLKAGLTASIQQIDKEIQRLDQALSRFQAREKELFARTVEAYKTRDDKRSKIYATEVAEVRKISKMMLQMKLALEQISLRMRTTTELGDIAASLLPVVDVMNDLRIDIASISPLTEKGMGDLGDLLNGIVIDVGLVGGNNLSFETVDEDAANILNEAQIVAQSKISDGFPMLRGEKNRSRLGEVASKP